MPLTSKGNEIMNAMQKQYGEKKGEQVFYASKNAGTIHGVDGEMMAMGENTAEATKAESPHVSQPTGVVDYSPSIDISNLPMQQTAEETAIRNRELWTDND